MANGLPKYLYLRGTQIIFRYKLPKKYQHIITEVKRSLGTDIGKACIEGQRLYFLIQKLIQDGDDMSKSKFMEYMQLFTQADYNTTKQALIMQFRTLISNAPEGCRNELDAGMIAKGLSVNPAEVIPDNITYTPLPTQNVKFPLLKDALEEWLKTIPNTGTRDKYREATKELLWAVGNEDTATIQDITNDLLTDISTLFGAHNTVGLADRSKLTLKGTIKQLNSTTTTARVLKVDYKISKIKNIRHCLNWLIKKKYISGIDMDILADPKKSNRKQGPRQRRTFSDTELTSIYNEIFQYKNAYSVLYRNTGEYRDWRWKYWGFVLLMFTGARAGEIAQLQIGDILPPDTINPLNIGQGVLNCWCVYLVEDDYGAKKLKTTPSVRLIPINEWMLNDFLKYYNSRKAKFQDMAPDDIKTMPLWGVNPSERRGFYAPFTKFYNETLFKKLREVQLINSGVSLHTTRHNVATQVEAISQQTGTSMYHIMGWSNKELTPIANTYVAKTTPLNNKNNLIDKITYDFQAQKGTPPVPTVLPAVTIEEPPATTKKQTPAKSAYGKSKTKP